MDFGAAIRQLVQNISGATASESTPTPASSSASQDIFSKIGTPTWNYAYDDNRAASVTGADGKEYFFVPQSYVQKGQVQGDFQQYTKQFLDPNTFKNAVAFELPEGMQSRLENKGFLWPADEFNKLKLEQYSGYNIDENNPAIVGLGNPHPSMQVGAPISYITQPKLAPGGERVQQDWITAADGRQGGLGQYAYYKYQGPLADAARGGLQAIGPLAPLLLEYAAPGMGLGFAYSAGNAAGKLATGQPGAAESLATSVILGQLGVGSGVAEATGSTVAGQVAQGTAGGLLAGKNLEQAATGAVKGVGLDTLASTIPSDTTAFDTTQDISDTSGFDIPTPTPQTPITGNTGGNMATYDDPTGGAGQYYGTEDDYYNQLYNFQGTPLDYATDPTGMAQGNTQYYDDPTGGAGGLGTNQNPSMYGNLTVEQLRRLLSGTAGGGGARPLTTAQRTAQQQALGSLLGGAVGGLGGILAGQTSAKASEEQARMISEATGRAVPGAQFRPIGTTTRFGTSQFQVDPTTGQLTSAGYQLTPELKAMQDRVMALTGQGLTEAEQAAGRYAPLTAGAQGLFGLGQQYLAQSPQQVAADYMARQQDLLAPSRERQLAQLQTQLFNTGRGGLSVGGTGLRPGGGQGLRASSPEMEAYYNALAQQDAQLAAGAQQAGQQQVQFGAGLMGTGANLLGAYGQGLTGAYAPFSTGIGVGSSLEQLGQQPLSLSQQLAQLSSTAGARAGELGVRGTTAASAARLPSMQYNPLARALVGAGGNTQFGNVLGQVAGNALPGLLGLFSGGMPTASDVYDAYGNLGDTGYSAADLYGLI